jgi:hypothetical protein
MIVVAVKRTYLTENIHQFALAFVSPLSSQHDIDACLFHHSWCSSAIAAGSGGTTNGLFQLVDLLG